MDIHSVPCAGISIRNMNCTSSPVHKVTDTSAITSRRSARGDLVLIGPNLPHNWISDLRGGETVSERCHILQFTEGFIDGCVERPAGVTELEPHCWPQHNAACCSSKAPPPALRAPMRDLLVASGCRGMRRYDLRPSSGREAAPRRQIGRWCSIPTNALVQGVVSSDIHSDRDAGISIRNMNCSSPAHKATVTSAITSRRSQAISPWS